MVDVPDRLFERDPPFFVVAGPCVLEDSDLNLRVADRIARVSDRLGIPAIFKASFDKANRTSLSSPRGPGLDEGLRRLEEVRDATGLPLLTDVHLPEQAAPAGEVVNALQVPAFLCRQTDLLLAAGRTGRPVNVKKGQWMAPEQIRHSVEKVRSGGSDRVAVTERGTAFGYGRWVVDMRSFRLMGRSCGCPTLYDATHSVQLPGGGGHASGGEPAFVPALARAAVAAGAAGVYVETHPEPSRAPSDGANMLPLDGFEGLLRQLSIVREAREAAKRETGAGDEGRGAAGVGPRPAPASAADASVEERP